MTRTLTDHVPGIRDNESRSLMFNTKDIVRWRKDGSLETFGRSDDQVKIKVNYLDIRGTLLINIGLSN